MESVLDIASWVLLLGGGALVTIGGIGIVRFPDVYTREPRGRRHRYRRRWADP